MCDFLAIDIGASSGRHILGRVFEEKIELKEIYRFPNSPVREGDRLVWDTERLFQEIVIGLKRAKELGRIPDSVGIDTWAVDYVLLGKDGRAPRFASCYRDPQTETAVKEAHSRVPFSELYARTGIQFQPFNTLYRLFAEREELRCARQLLMLPDYFHFLLTGKTAREYTNATSTGLISLGTGTWDGELLQRLDLTERLFPEPVPPGTEAGTFTEALAREVGYSARVVLPATHDTASAVIGSGAEEGELYLSSGTWSLLGSVEPLPHIGEKSRVGNFTNEGHIGGKFRLQKNIMGLWMIQQLRKEERPDLSFSELTALAEPTERTVDVDDPRFLAPRNMKRAIESVVGELSLPQTVYCVLNSLAKSYRRAAEELREITGKSFRTLNVFGGGSKNTLLNRLTEAETGMKVATGPAEATVLGNLVEQMLAAGAISSLGQARTLIKNSF